MQKVQSFPGYVRWLFRGLVSDILEWPNTHKAELNTHTAELHTHTAELHTNYPSYTRILQKCTGVLQNNAKLDIFLWTSNK